MIGGFTTPGGAGAIVSTVVTKTGSELPTVAQPPVPTTASSKPLLYNVFAIAATGNPTAGKIVIGVVVGGTVAQ